MKRNAVERAPETELARGHEGAGGLAAAGASSKWLVLIAVGVSSFMTALDGSVVNTVLPIINSALGTRIDVVEWVITIYLLVVSGLLLTFGRLGDLRGHKSVYVVGFGLFVVGSALSGLAATVGALIAWRAFQAVGGAMVLSNAPAILVGSFPPAQRGRALGLQATMTYLGLSTGPALGGLLATQFSWRAVFYINVPVGLLALALSVRFVPREPPADFAERFDLTGAFTFLLGLVALLLALNQGPEWGWASAPVLASFAVAAVSLGAFLGTESKVVAPMLDLSLFRRRIFSAASASAVMNYVCLYSVLFLLPFYLIQGRGLTAEQAGLVLTAEPVVMAIAAPISGSLSDWIGSRLLSTAGMLILAGGMFWLSRLGPAVPLTRVALALAVVGLGIGAFIAPNTSALMGAAPRQRHGTAAGVLATARNVGMVLGVGLAAAVLTSYVPDADAATAGPALFAGVSAGLLVAAGVACIGSLTSAVRGSTHPPADR